MLALLGLLVTLTATVQSYPTGPPTFACVAMMPGHGFDPQDNAKSPYKVRIMQKSKIYQPGQEISVHIRGTTGFKGFFLQARNVSTSYTGAVGSFINAPADSKTIDCGGNAASAMGHINNDVKDKSGLIFTWVAPADLDIDVVFVATVVEQLDTYWVKLQSSELRRDLCEPNPCANNGRCKNTNRGFRCRCRRAFKGKLCDRTERSCDSVACLNGGICSDGKCNCVGGFLGKRCQNDPCDPNPCEEGQTCSRTNRRNRRCT